MNLERFLPFDSESSGHVAEDRTETLSPAEGVERPRELAYAFELVGARSTLTQETPTLVTQLEAAVLACLQEDRHIQLAVHSRESSGPAAVGWRLEHNGQPAEEAYHR